MVDPPAVADRVTLLLVGVLLAACRKTPAPMPPAVDAAPSASVAEPTIAADAAPVAASAASAGPSLALSPTRALPDAGVGTVSASAVVAFPERTAKGTEGAAVVVYATPVDDQSDILGRVLDVDGRWVGPARLLRRTSGRVRDLAVDVQGDRVWIAWASTLGEGKHLAAVAQADRALQAMSAPVTLVHDKLDDGQPNHWVKTIALSSGHAIVATRSAGEAVRCLLREAGEMCRGPGYKVFDVARDGAMRVVAHGALDGNPLEMAPLVDVGSGVVARAWAWHGGAVSKNFVVATGAGTTPPSFVYPECNPPYEQAWTGDELVTLCARDYASNKTEKCPGTAEPTDPCPRLARARANADAGAPERNGGLVRSIDEICEAGHPVVRVIRSDGSSFVLDPTKAGVSIPRFAGFTGRVLLVTPEVDGEGTGMLVLTRRRCRGTALIDEPVE